MYRGYYPRKPAVERFWEAVSKDGPIHPVHGQCWVWTKSGCNGYGLFKSNGKSTRAHRYSWEIHNSQIIPEGMMILHKCDNTRCVNPSHLVLGTGPDNVKDKVSKGRQARNSGHGRAKLDFDKADYIRIHYIKGDKVFGATGLGKKFGVADFQIRMVVKGLRWVRK